MKMRRILSLVLVTAMLLSAAVFTAPAASAVGEEAPELDWGNSYATAHYFGGYVEFYETNGTSNQLSSLTPAKECTTVKYKGITDDDALIMLDGRIDEGEWGNPSISISSDYATWSLGEKNGNSIQGRNPKYDWPSAENTYFHYLNSRGKYADGTVYGMSFDAYFLWDEYNLYVAVKVIDIDGFENKKDQTSTESAWNGDAVQMRIDPQGPNSVVGGKGYDASVNTRPWKNIKRRSNDSGSPEIYSEIPNFVFAMVEPTNGSRKTAYVDRWDAAKRYTPVPAPTEDDPDFIEYHESDVSNGVIEDDRGINFTSVYAAATTKGLTMYDPTVEEQTPQSKLARATLSQYEIAIPWEYMDTSAEALSSPKNYYSPVAGDVLGIAMTVLNAARGTPGYNALLEWGNGITGNIFNNHTEVAGGSNALVLSDVNYNETGDACAHQFADPTCTEGYVCTACGYEKGHKLGHSYSFSNGVVPAEDQGGLTATCDRCNQVIEKSLKDVGYEKVASFMETDISTEGNGFLPGAFDSGSDEDYKSGWTKPWKYADGSYVQVNGRTRTAYDDKAFGYAVADFTQLNHTGTALYGQTFGDMLSFSYQMEVYITGYNPAIPDAPANYNQNNSSSDPYTAGIYWAYGGDVKSGYASFQSGLIYIEETDSYYFAIIRNNNSAGGKIRTEEQLKDKALTYVKMDDAKKAEVKDNWHTFRMVYDDRTSTTYLLWDDELMTYAYSPFMTYNRPDKGNSCVVRMFDIPFYAKNVQIQRLKATDVSPAPEDPGENPEPGLKFTATVNGVAGEYEAGETVSVTLENKAVEVKNGYAYRFTGWTGDVEFEDANAAETTFVMPDHDVTVEAVYGMLIGDVNDDGVIDSVDALTLVRMVAGAASVPAADIDNDGDIGPMDMVLMKRYIAGTYIPNK